MALWPNPLTPQFLRKYVEERPTQEGIRQQLIGLNLLPTEEVEEYELTWDVIRGENELAGVYAHEGIPVPGSDILFEQMAADIMNLMATRIVKESDVMTLRDAGDPGLHSGSRAAYRRAAKRTRRLMDWCDNTINNTVEYLIMQALTGTLVWPPQTAAGVAIPIHQKQWGRVTFALVYPFRAAFLQNITTLAGAPHPITGVARPGGGLIWTNPASLPILDIEVLLDLAQTLTGASYDGATAIMSRRVLSYLASNVSIINWVQTTEKGTNFVSTKAFKTFIKTKFDLNIQTYDAQWTYRTNLDAAVGPTINYLNFLTPGNMIILPPGVSVGNFATGPAKANKWKKGKYTWMIDDIEPPFDTRMGVGQKGFPMIYRPTDILCVNVWA